MNRTKVILSIFLMLFLLLAGLVLPSFWKSQKKEASGNKGREPAKETTETNSDTPMPEYLDFDALKAFFSDSQIASLKEQFPVYLKEYVKKEQTSITFLPEKTSYPTETTVCLMFSLSDQDTLPVTYHTPTGVFLFSQLISRDRWKSYCVLHPLYKTVQTPDLHLFFPHDILDFLSVSGCCFQLLPVKY